MNQCNSYHLRNVLCSVMLQEIHKQIRIEASAVHCHIVSLRMTSELTQPRAQSRVHHLTASLRLLRHENTWIHYRSLSFFPINTSPAPPSPAFPSQSSYCPDHTAEIPPHPSFLTHTCQRETGPQIQDFGMFLWHAS